MELRKKLRAYCVFMKEAIWSINFFVKFTQNYCDVITEKDTFGVTVRVGKK